MSLLFKVIYEFFHGIFFPVGGIHSCACTRTKQYLDPT